MPLITLAARRRAAERLIPEFAHLVRGHQIPDSDDVLELFDTWQRAVCAQLANFPADFKIEQWILPLAGEVGAKRRVGALSSWGVPSWRYPHLSSGWIGNKTDRMDG
jgi:hypothetical protein